MLPVIEPSKGDDVVDTLSFDAIATDPYHVLNSVGGKYCGSLFTIRRSQVGMALRLEVETFYEFEEVKPMNNQETLFTLAQINDQDFLDLLEKCPSGTSLCDYKEVHRYLSLPKPGDKRYRIISMSEEHGRTTTCIRNPASNLIEFEFRPKEKLLAFLVRFQALSGEHIVTQEGVKYGQRFCLRMKPTDARSLIRPIFSVPYLSGARVRVLKKKHGIAQCSRPSTSQDATVGVVDSCFSSEPAAKRMKKMTRKQLFANVHKALVKIREENHQECELILQAIAESELKS